MNKEIDKFFEMFVNETKAFSSGCDLVSGVDEVGRGPLAGPVLTSVVTIKSDFFIPGVNDSKKLSENRRNILSERILNSAFEVTTHFIDNEEIDEINILNATKKAMRVSVEKLNTIPDIIFVDALIIPDIEIKQLSLIHGDALSVAIAAASIIAKVKRDSMMVEYDKIYPGYGFSQNKGYGTAQHIAALKMLGPCPIHRKTFIKNFI
jgi:ribonuclease HII